MNVIGVDLENLDRGGEGFEEIVVIVVECKFFCVYIS